jgi:hypothetical protein
MQEEIFGPLLPVLTYESFDEASHIDSLLRDPKVTRDLDADPLDGSNEEKRI